MRCGLLLFFNLSHSKNAAFYKKAGQQNETFYLNEFRNSKRRYYLEDPSQITIKCVEAEMCLRKCAYDGVRGEMFRLSTARQTAASVIHETEKSPDINLK